MTILAGKYRLGQRIAGGGMAEVIEAEVVGAEGFARKVAIKRVLGAMSADPRFGEMFVNEARIASLLHHPNVVSVLDFDRDDDGHHYLVMELVRGVDLRRLADTGRLPVSLTAHIVGEILRGLAYAHELMGDGRHLGIVHRDISPHNVMVEWSGAVKVVDFGIAKAVAATGASRSGSLKGKVAYMSPEQAHGRELDGRSDVFAVGIILHELLTGERLFDGGNEAEILSRLLIQPIPRPCERVPGIPEDLDALCMTMVERDLESRLPSARIGLERILECGALSARASDDLGQLIRARFPGEAPPSADVSGPVRRKTPNQEPGPRNPAQAALPASAATPRLPPTRTLPDEGGRSPERRSRWWFPVAAVGAVMVGLVGTAFLLNGDADGDGQRGNKATAELAGSDDATLPEPRRDAPGTPRSAAANAAPSAANAAPSAANAAPSAADAAPSAANAAPEGASSESRGTRENPAEKHRTKAATPQGRGTLKVLVEPWALVTIDGKSHGQTPVVVDVRAGRHKVVIENDGFKKRETVRPAVRPGKTTEIRRKWGVAY